MESSYEAYAHDVISVSEPFCILIFTMYLLAIPCFILMAVYIIHFQIWGRKALYGDTNKLE